MKQAVKDRGGEDLVVEDLAPVREALVAGHDQAGSLVPADQEPEEEAGLLAGEREISGGPSSTTFSVRSTKLSPASSRSIFRSTEGWKSKSNCSRLFSQGKRASLSRLSTPRWWRPRHSASSG